MSLVYVLTLIIVFIFVTHHIADDYNTIYASGSV